MQLKGRKYRRWDDDGGGGAKRKMRARTRRMRAVLEVAVWCVLGGELDDSADSV